MSEEGDEKKDELGGERRGRQWRAGEDRQAINPS